MKGLTDLFRKLYLNWMNVGTRTDFTLEEVLNRWSFIPIPTPANSPGRTLYPEETFTYSPAKPSLKRTPASTFPANPRMKLGFRTSCPNAVTDTIIAITATNKCFISKVILSLASVFKCCAIDLSSLSLNMWFDRLTDRDSAGSPTMVRQAHQPWFGRFTDHGSAGSPTMVRQAHQPWFDRFTDHGSAGSPTMVRQAHRPWFGRLTNHGSTGSPTVVRQTHRP